MITHKLADVARRVFKSKPLETKKSVHNKRELIIKLYKQERQLSTGLYVMEIDKNALSFNSHSENESFDFAIDLYLRASNRLSENQLALAEI